MVILGVGLLSDLVTLIWLFNGPVVLQGGSDMTNLEVEDAPGSGVWIPQLFDAQNSANSIQTADGTGYVADCRWRVLLQPAGIAGPLQLPENGLVS